MKDLLPSQIKKPTKLFNNKYRAKVVLRTAMAHLVRPEHGKKLIAGGLDHPEWGFEEFYGRRATPETKLFIKSLLRLIDYDTCSIRVEYPLVTIYTNDTGLINNIINLKGVDLKYISIFDPSDSINPGEVVSSLPYDYKVYVNQISAPMVEFVNWCKQNKNIRLPRSTERLLIKGKPVKAGYLYVTGEKTLTMVKMFLGSTMQRIEKIVSR